MKKEKVSKFNPNISLHAKFMPINSNPRSDPSIREMMLQNIHTMVEIKERSDYDYLSLYKDNWPLLKFRKCLKRILISISILSSLITRSKSFEFFIALTILFNTVLLSLEDPSLSTQPSPYKELELFCLVIYTIESLLKILSQGLIVKKTSYFRDPLNMIDFIIVLTAWLDQFSSQGFNLNALRVMRILKPLRSLTSIKGLRLLTLSLFDSLVPLIAALVILLFCLLIFAVAGLQLFMGLFRFKCFDVDSGVFDDSEVCRDGTCGEKICVEDLDNPWNGGLNFDNIFFAFVAVFQVITLEGWYTIMKKTQISFNFFSFLYFLPLVYFGSYLLVNLTQAIIAISFTNAVEESEKVKNDENLSLHSSMLSDSEEDGLIDETLLMSFVENRKVRKSYVMVFNEKNLNDSQFNEEQIDESKIADEDSRFVQIKEEKSYLAASILNRQSKLLRSIRQNSDNGPRKSPHLRKIKKTLKVSSVLGNRLRSRNLREKDLKYCIKDVWRGRLESSSSFDVLPEESKTLTRGMKYIFSYKTSKKAAHPDIIQIKKCKARANKEKFSECLTQMDLQRFLSKRFTFFYSFYLHNLYVREVIQESFEIDRISRQVLGNHSIFDVIKIKRPEDCSILIKTNNMKFTIWALGCWGFIQRAVQPICTMAESIYFKNFMTVCVLINVSCLCYDHYGISETDQMNLRLINDMFTFIFLVEFGIKLLDFGLLNIFRDKMNILDFAVIIGGLVEYFFNYGSSALNAFRAVRILRIFRLTKLMRILKPLRSLKKLLKVISRSITNLSLLILLLLIFCIIFTLLGMQIFGGEFDFPEKPRCNFDSFFSSFLCIFQVLSTENWNEILMNSIRSKGPAGALFFIIWIIIGNFVILNLILAILIQKFKKSPSDSEMLEASQKNKDRVKAKRYTRISKKKIDKKQKIIQNIREISDIDDEEIVNIEQLYIKKITHVNTDIKTTILSDTSYGYLQLNSPIRAFFIKISSSIYFEFFIVGVILSNTVKLIWDTYNSDAKTGSSVQKVSFGLDVMFTCIYTLEFLVKSISNGLVLGQNTYLRDNWNRVDFVILVFSFFDITDQVHVPIIRVFRLIRTLRPLKFITHNIRMKIIVTALLESILALSNVMIVIMMAWLVFAILGVSLFAGKLYSCSNSKISSKEICESSGFSWKNSNFNFDNVYEALIVLFVISSQESWPDRMYEGIDTRSTSLSPSRDASPWASFYFIASVLIGNMFLTNLFAAVVFSKFSEAKQSEESYISLLLSKEQLLWIHIMSLITKESPKSVTFSLPKNKYRKLLHSCVSHTYFEIFMTLIILINGFSLAADYYEAPGAYHRSIEGVNLFCTYVFILESSVKILALGFREYFYSHWNKFDFLVVLTSIANLIVEGNSSNNLYFLRFAPQLIRVVRVLRVTKVFRVFNFLRPLQRLVVVVSYALPNIVNVLLLLSLIFMIFAILGSFLFGGVNQGVIVDDYTNFHNFHQSLFTLWRVSTGEDYPLLMYDCAEQSGRASLVFFVVFIGLTTFLILDLFISIVIETYEDYEKNPDNILINFSEKLELFKIAWGKFTHESKGARIHYSLLTKLMVELGTELGVSQDLPSEKIIKTLNVMDMNIDPDGFTYFHDMLYAVMRRKYAFKLLNRQGQINQNRILLRNEETKTKIKIASLRIQNRLKLEKKGRLSLPVRELTVKKGNTFISWMYLRIVFQALKKWKDRKKLFFDLSRSSEDLETSRLD